MSTAHWMGLLVLFPLLSAVLLSLLPAAWRRPLGLVCALMTAACYIPLPSVVLDRGTVVQNLGGWPPPLGIELRIDGLSALLLLFMAIVGVCVSIYAFSYFSTIYEKKQWSVAPHFWPLWLLQWAGLNAIALSADLFNLYVTLEVISFSSAVMVTLSGTKEALDAALRYLFFALLGSLAYLMGIGLLYEASGVLDLYLLAERLEASSLALLGTGLLIAGLLVKAALLPMHFWLPRAHANAPGPVSGILSGLVITAAYYLLFRLWFYVITPLSPEHLANLLGVLGSGAILWGGWCALQQERVKLVLAYSTVSQVGYLFLVFALTVQREESQGLAWAGAVFLALSHGLAKAGAFLAASSLLAATGSDRLDALRGVARRYPMAAMTFALAAVSLMGLPPTGGFIGKWMLLKAVVMNGQWGYAFVIIAGGLLAACYLFRVLECFVDAPEGTKRAVPGIPFWQLLPAFCLALLAIGLALGVAWPMELLKVDAPVTFISQVVTEVPNP